MDQLVARLQDAIKLVVIKPQVGSRQEEKSPPGFYVKVTLDDPRVAQQVCSDISSMFVEENLRQRERAAQGTTNFLQGQLEGAKTSLDQQDAKVADFERKYFGMLPDQTQTNLNLLQALNTQLETVTQGVNRAELDKTYTQSMLDQEMASWQESKEATDSGKPTQKSLQQQLVASQDRLVKLQAEYTDSYPDVIKQKAVIAKLKSRIAAQKAGAKKAQAQKSKAAATTTASTTTVAASEPPSILQLQSQLRSDNEAIRIGSTQQDKVRKQIQEVEGRLQLSPSVQEEYKKITRDHETALLVYNSLLKKRDESAMATDLERAQQGEQFVIMDPANLPKNPSFPNRLEFAGGGLGGGLALGLALALLLEMLDKSLRNEADVEALLEVVPLATIPLVERMATGKGKVMHSRHPAHA